MSAHTTTQTSSQVGAERALDVENRATVARTTCGWRRPELDRDAVRHYWRDVHSPAIARRDGVHWYRHSPFDAVVTDLFAPVDGIDFACPDDAQLMWQSDVVYLDEDGVRAFMASPGDPAVTATILADIEMIVERSTTYRSVDDHLHTYVDTTGDPVPMGPRPLPTYGVFVRRRSDEAAFRTAMQAMAESWAAQEGVRRLRLSLFDAPDMEAERRAGYPVKTHPVEQQYQAWTELVLDDPGVARRLLTPADGVDHAAHLATVHAYPVPATYTFVHDGAPTIIGLRGYAAHQAIEGLGATHALTPALLEWMYGPVARPREGR